MMKLTNDNIRILKELLKLTDEDIKKFKITIETDSLLIEYGSNTVEIIYDDKFQVNKIEWSYLMTK